MSVLFPASPSSPPPPCPFTALKSRPAPTPSPPEVGGTTSTLEMMTSSLDTVAAEPKEPGSPRPGDDEEAKEGHVGDVGLVNGCGEVMPDETGEPGRSSALEREAHLAEITKGRLSLRRTPFHNLSTSTLYPAAEAMT